MKRFNFFWVNAIALALVVSFAGAALAADNGGPATQNSDKPLKGKIVSVATDGTSIVISSGKSKNATQTTVTCDDKTAVTIDGTAGKVTDLKAGLYVSISPATGTATTITATSSAGKKKGGN